MFQLAMKMLQVSINSLNRLYAEVEKVPTYCEGCFGLPTAHITAVVDFTINSLNRLYAEVEKVPTYCEGCFGLPTAHITAVVDQEGLLLV